MVRARAAARRSVRQQLEAEVRLRRLVGRALDRARSAFGGVEIIPGRRGARGLGRGG